jgi:hypothetical protein
MQMDVIASSCMQRAPDKSFPLPPDNPTRDHVLIGCQTRRFTVAVELHFQAADEHETCFVLTEINFKYGTELQVQRQLKRRIEA